MTEQRKEGTEDRDDSSSAPEQTPAAADDATAVRTPVLPPPPHLPGANDHAGTEEISTRGEASSAESDDDATRIQKAVPNDSANDQLISDELAPKLDGKDHPEGDAEAAADPSEAPTEVGQRRDATNDSIFRPTDAAAAAPPVAATAVLPLVTSTPDDRDEQSDEERKLAAERAARREAREQALAAPDQTAQQRPAPVVVTRRNTDRFLGSLGLFLLRLVVAAIFAVRGLEIVTNVPAAQASFAQTLIPQPQIMAIVAGAGALAIAVALVFGLLVRVAGLGIVAIAAGVLAFVLWGNWSPFVAGRSGFIGELELVLAAVGVLFLLVGGGGFGLDRSFRKSRERDKLANEEDLS